MQTLSQSDYESIVDLDPVPMPPSGNKECCPAIRLSLYIMALGTIITLWCNAYPPPLGGLESPHQMSAIPDVSLAVHSSPKTTALWIKKMFAYSPRGHRGAHENTDPQHGTRDGVPVDPSTVVTTKTPQVNDGGVPHVIQRLGWLTLVIGGSFAFALYQAWHADDDVPKDSDASCLTQGTDGAAKSPPQSPIGDVAERKWKKFLPLTAMFFAALFGYAILVSTKDVLMVTAPKSGAEVCRLAPCHGAPLCTTPPGGERCVNGPCRAVPRCSNATHIVRKGHPWNGHVRTNARMYQWSQLTCHVLLVCTPHLQLCVDGFLVFSYPLMKSMINLN